MSTSADAVVPPPTRRRILVVEDEALVAADLEERLEALGFEVCGVADSCEGAITDAHALRPDLGFDGHQSHRTERRHRRRH